ncbi:universal stress protein [Winogradskyella aurantiaca]|uniref:universal stress protein n=1 Tax=Winogradskyella aurantiaca TaxID=2219558 RepID=UPI000E1C798A|nr:universal stress protein [Winogradskyella aurantiaca]
MKHILLLTDFSESARNAIDYATAFWSEEVCTFHLLHVVRSGYYTTESLISGEANADIYESLLSTSKTRLETLYESLSKTNNNSKHQFKAHLDHDSFIAAINQLIEKESIEVVVLGSNGASNVSEVFFGSHALKVMRHLEHNVLVVPEHFNFSPVKQILVLIDSKDDLNQNQIQRIEALSQSLKSHIHLLCMNFEDATLEALVTTKFTAKVHLVNIKEVPIEYATSTYIQANNINMLVMLGQMEGFVDRLKGSSGKTRVSKLYQLPILLLRE